MTIDTPRAARKINQLLDLQPGSIVLVSSNLGDTAFELVVDNDSRSRAWISGVLGKRMRDAELAEFAEDITTLHVADDISANFIPERFRRR